MGPSTGPPNAEVENSVQSSNVHLTSPDMDHHSPSIHLTTSSQPWFPNASNFEVKDSQLNNITTTNVTINNNDSVSTILWPHVAAGAIFNSAARYAAGKCHPGTRKKIIDQIVNWINDPDPTKSVLWIYGPAGAGKSAIAQTICELVKESHPHNGGGSFFFTSGHTDCGNALKLFTTLSYQLAIQFPFIRAEINNALSHDPSLPTKSMEIQLLSLIIQPLLHCRKSLSRTPVLIVDGLDECANEKGTTQGDIVALISKSIVEHNIPLRFMILSRPEYWIRDAFDTAPLPNITFSLSLRDDMDADKDIRAYLTEEFERIHVENKRFMKSVVPPWPPADTIDHLVYEASGQFIYASTVLKFVGNISKFSNPQKQLDIIMSPGPHRALAFSELDRLYATILSAYPQWETMKRVLATLLLDANTTIITVFLGVDSDELALVLDALSSLIEIEKPGPLSENEMFLESICGSPPDPNDIISFCHRSFREFLEDETRSGAFYIDLASDTVPKEIVNGYFDMVYGNMEQNYKIEPHIFSNVDLATYSHKFPRVTRVSIFRCCFGSETMIPLITDMTAKLTIFSPSRLAHVHSVFYFIHSMDLFRDIVLDVFPSLIFPHMDSNENPALLELQSVWQSLEEAINLACRNALSVLATCTDFQVTPTFVYLTEYWFSEDKSPLDGLCAIGGVTDAISSLKQHRYIFLYRYFYGGVDRWNPPGESLFPNNTNPNWRTHGAWRDLRISFVPKGLKSILETLPNKEGVFDGYDTQDIVVARFFDSRSISDIGDEDYFQNASNLAILGVMTDLAAWVANLKFWPSWVFLPQHFLVSMISWFNRQLKYDKTLQQKMTTVMKYIFEHGFLQVFTDAYPTSDYLAVWDGDSDNSKSTIKVWPLLEGAYKEKNTLFVRWRFPSDDWQTFHDEVFGNVEQNINPIIHPSEWHPHLVTRLLINLAEFLDDKIHPKFRWERHNYKKLLSYTTQCMPYAHPTPENLDALRVIVYLYPQVTPAWDTPEGLWPSLAEHIQKYEPSILSAEEKQLFLLWLNSEEHADIKTYMDRISSASPSALEGSRESESTALNREGEGDIESL